MLNPFQAQVFDFVVSQAIESRRLLHQGGQTNPLILGAAYAFALYHDLETNGVSLTFGEHFIRNRGRSPSDPEFFRHLHALEEFVKAVRAATAVPRTALSVPPTGKRPASVARPVPGEQVAEERLGRPGDLLPQPDDE